MHDPDAPFPPTREPAPKARIRSRKRATAAWGLRAMLAAGLLLVVAFFFLTRTDRGASLVLEQVLQRLPINGEISAVRARSGRLLEGVRLYQLSIRGDDGRLFLLADSARLRYDLRTLVSGNVVFDALELWGPRVMVTRYPGEPTFNVQRLFISEEEVRDTATTPGKDIIFRDVALHDGEVRVLYPAEGDPGRFVTVPVPGGEGALVRHSFTELAARLPLVVLASPDAVGQRVAIDSLAFVGRVFADPVRVRDVQGRLRNDDGRLDVELDRLALAGSTAEGSVFVEVPPGEAPPRYGFDLTTEGLDLADLEWLDPRVPAGRAVGRLTMDAEGEERQLVFDALEVTSEGSRVRLDGGLAMGQGEVRFEALDVRASPLALARVAPWMEGELPVEGTVEGTVELDGPLDRLATRGRATLRRPGPGRGPVTADFSGRLSLGDEIGFTDFRATLDPFDFDLLGDFADGLRLDGPGRVTFRATGRAGDLIRFSAEIHHRPPDLPASDVLARGNVTRRGGRWVLDVQSDVGPLSLTALKHDYPTLPVSGEVSGSLRARGPLEDLSLQTDLTTAAGRLALNARLDATDPGAHYAVQGQVADFALSRLVPGLPDPTALSGYIDVEGHGIDPATLTLDARARLRPSRVGGLHVDTAVFALRVRDGTLRVDTLEGVFGGVAVQGRGELAMEAGTPGGTVRIAFQSDSLGRLRPLALGDVVIARDTLTALDRELLLAEGVDPDTLPVQAEVTMSGAVRGEVTLTGSVQDFSASGNASFERVRYGANVIRGADVTFEGAGLPGLEGRFNATLRADSMTLMDRAFAGAEVELEYAQPRGRVAVRLERHEAEDYTARALFEVQGREGSVELEQLAFRFDSLVWSLDRPALLAWNERGLSIEDLALRGPGDSVRVEVDGTVPRQGAADLRVNVEGLPLERISGLLQREDLSLSGKVGMTARVTGTARAPLIDASFEVVDLDVETFALSRLAGELAYGDRTLRLDLQAWRESLRVLSASGQVPVDLAFQEVGRRVPPDREMSLDVVADSLPAAFVFGYLDALRDVEGTLSGRFHIAGTVDDPSPTGTLALNDAGWTLEALGVRHRDIRGTLTLRPDGTVDVNAAGRSAGTIAMTGTVTLQPLTDPVFDLRIALSNFRAVSRRDVVGNVSGLLTLTGSYSRPVVRSLPGQPLRVVEGVLYVEEFQRTASVVDLGDPAFFSVVDTSVVNPRPLLGATTNPFLRNLRVAVDLVVERDSWLRSGDMNVEMAGELQVVYDRQSGDLVLLGDLEAIRGSYAVLGRRFEVQSGTVEFVGTPGINPILNIVAGTRVRPTGIAGGGDPIQIQAAVTGTLQSPRVGLTSPEGAIAESDLVSYLVFGVPSYQLASGQQAALRGAGGLLGTTFGAGLSILQGTIANQLSSLVARQWGLDYFAITQPDQLGLTPGSFGSTLQNTTFEVGWYLDQNVFLTLLVRPLGSVGGGTSDPFGGARLDWVLSDTWTAQAFFEDRFLRQSTLGFDRQLLASEKVAGFFIFREWGYGGGAAEPEVGEAEPAPEGLAP